MLERARAVGLGDKYGTKSEYDLGHALPERIGVEGVSVSDIDSTADGNELMLLLGGMR
jgi:hypothetical protein